MLIAIFIRSAFGLKDYLSSMPVPFSISLVIPAYNRGKLIEETIASALGQHQPFAEIVVVDDGSTDATVARLAKFGDRITLIRSENHGVQQARNRGVAACRSAYVALCDSDDMLEPDFTQTMGRAIEKQADTDIWYCNFVLFSGDALYADKLSLAPAGFLEGAVAGADYCVEIPELYERVLHYQPFFPTGSVFSKRFYESIGGYDKRFKGIGAEDFEFLLRAICHGRLGYVTKPIARVRKHEGNDSGDTLRALNGEARILEYSLAQHPGADRYRAAILSSIDKRRRDAFDVAYARGDFMAVRNTADLFNKPPTDRNFKLKKAISHFPPIVREMAWRISQSMH
jgi:glycosyltransferase involved in cell wall biosynthesis